MELDYYSQNNRIHKFDTNGNFITKWGDIPTEVYGICIDPAVRVNISILIGSKIKKFDSSGNLIMEFSVPFYPYGINSDSVGNLYITGDDYKIHVYEPQY